MRCTKNKSARSGLVLRSGAGEFSEFVPLPGLTVPVTGCPLPTGTVLRAY